jgi:hypothetical protein
MLYQAGAQWSEVKWKVKGRAKRRRLKLKIEVTRGSERKMRGRVTSWRGV